MVMVSEEGVGTTSGLMESRDDSELENPRLANSLLKSFSGLKDESTPLAFMCLLVASCRSLSASAIRTLMLARSPFRAVKSWCTVSQFSSVLVLLLLLLLVLLEST